MSYYLPSMGRVLRYCFTPEIRQRLSILRIRLGHFSLAIATILAATRLLPRNHPALNPSNCGQFGIIKLLSISANNISFSLRDADRLLVWCAIVFSLLILVLQTLFIFTTAVVPQAQAAGFFSISSDAARRDIVMIFLDHIFGVPEVFNTGAAAVGSPVHGGIHALLAFYSQAMMIIATLIILYYVFIVVGESAQSGTPFGRRFNGLWAPIRLVLALGLLVPLGSGLNSAQYITLYIAKFGSAFGSNAWAVFAEKIADPSPIATAPDVESTRSLVKSLFISEVCREAARLPAADPETPVPFSRLQSLGSASKVPNLADPQTLIADARAAGQESVVISWTRVKEGRPITSNDCGSVGISLNVLMRGDSGTAGNALKAATEPMVQAYVGEIGRILADFGDETEANYAPRVFASIYVPYSGNAIYGNDAKLAEIEAVVNTAATKSVNRVKTSVQSAYTALSGSEATETLLDDMVKWGWGGASIWYVKLGQLNQKFQTAVRDGTPTFSNIVLPVAEADLQADPALADINRIAVQQAARFVERTKPVGSNSAAFTYDGENGARVVDSEEYWSAFKDRPFETALNFVFQTDYLRLLRTNATLDPMTVLVTAGSRLIERSVVAFAIGLLGESVGESASWFSNIPYIGHIAKIVGALAKAIGAFCMGTALIGFIAGVILFYLLPIFPFIYFFFSIIGWGLSIVEAMLAMPLWALAHLRIEGDGLPGPGALTGYFLLFEIMLRPVLIVSGLIIGYTVFGAGAYLLATVFDTLTNFLDAEIDVSSILTDSTPTTTRGASSGFDNFIYTIIFTTIIYGMALSCFKLSDRLPDSIMRWFGAPSGTSPFASGRDAPDVQGTMLAGSAAVATVASGIQTAASKFRLRKSAERGGKPEPKIQDADAPEQSRGGPNARAK